MTKPSKSTSETTRIQGSPQTGYAETYIKVPQEEIWAQKGGFVRKGLNVETRDGCYDVNVIMRNQVGLAVYNSKICRNYTCPQGPYTETLLQEYWTPINTPHSTTKAVSLKLHGTNCASYLSINQSDRCSNANTNYTNHAAHKIAGTARTPAVQRWLPTSKTGRSENSKYRREKVITVFFPVFFGNPRKKNFGISRYSRIWNSGKSTRIHSVLFGFPDNRQLHVPFAGPSTE